ncbi:MAG: hypothetical protein ACI9CE_003161 [Flavobacterium sp.]|jgi:hypothetical protein
MVVWAEIPYITRTSPLEADGENALKQMSELVKQNYKSGIVFWGVQNEITIAGKANNVEGIVSALHTQTKTLDPYRLTTQAQVSMLPHKDSLNRVSGINVYNKYFGWYNGRVEEFDTWISDFHRDCPDIPLGISEYGAEGIQMYHNDAPRRSDYSEEYHALYHEKMLEILSRHDYLWGTYVWNMLDFACDLRDAVKNWFNSQDQQENAEAILAPEGLFPEGYFSIKRRVGDVCDDTEGEKFMRAHLAPLFDHRIKDFIKNMSFEDLAEMNKGSLTPPVLKALNRGFTKIKSIPIID